MRAWLVGMLLIGGCAHAPAPEPLPAIVIARGDVPAPPVPAYGGVVHTSECAIRFERAGKRELAARLAAFRARLPAGADVELTPLGDRARRVSFTIDAPASHHGGAQRAATIAGAFVRDSAELWGMPAAGAGERPWRADGKGGARGVYAFEYARGSTLFAPGVQREIRVVVRIDLRHGRLDAGVVGEPLPDVTVCAHPVVDAARARAVLLAHRPVRYPTITDGDIIDAIPWLWVDGRSARWIAAVPYGHALAAAAADRDAVEGFLLVDPDAEEVLGVVSARSYPYDPDYNATGDAAALFGETDSFVLDELAR